MASVLALSAVDRGLESRSGQTKDYKIGICCFSAKHAALRRKSKYWLVRNQDKVSEWSDMSISGLLFQWASTIKIQLRVLFKYKADLVIISSKIKLFSPKIAYLVLNIDIANTIAGSALNNNHSVIHSTIELLSSNCSIIPGEKISHMGFSRIKNKTELDVCLISRSSI